MPWIEGEEGYVVISQRRRVISLRMQAEPPAWANAQMSRSVFKKLQESMVLYL